MRLLDRRDAETKRRRDENETETNKRERESDTRREGEQRGRGTDIRKMCERHPTWTPPSPPPPPPLPDLQVMVASVPVTAEEPRVARTAGVYFKAPSRAVDELCD